MSEGHYQVIARRWRPQQFDEIVGQEHIVRTLKNAIVSGRIGHAYLFVGPRGTGKTTTARIFAKALNCTGGPSPSPSPDDPICRAIVAGSCMDVIEIDAASNRSIDDAKQIRDECRYAPVECRFKIYIIDEVHQLTKDAFNTLLKILEEPPPHVKFIFATTESDKVMDTITSRCQRFEFRPIEEEKIAARLTEIVNADGVRADHAALLAIARLANGGMRDSQSILDQVISFCGKNISEADVLDIYGLASAGEIDALAAAFAAGDHAAVIALADRFVADGRDLVRVLRHAQARVREALLDAIRNGGETSALGAPLDSDRLLRILETLQAGEPALKGGLSERTHFEVTLLKAVEQSRARPIDALIKDLAAIAADIPEDAGLKKIIPAQPAPRATPPPPAPAKTTPATKAPQTPAAEKIVAKTAATQPPPREKTPTPASTDAFSDGPPPEDLEMPAGHTDTIPVEFLSEENSAPKRPVFRAGDPDFEAAVAALPANIRAGLEENFRATFIELTTLDETRLIGAGGKVARVGRNTPTEDTPHAE